MVKCPNCGCQFAIQQQNSQICSSVYVQSTPIFNNGLVEGLILGELISEGINSGNTYIDNSTTVVDDSSFSDC